MKKRIKLATFILSLTLLLPSAHQVLALEEVVDTQVVPLVIKSDDLRMLADNVIILFDNSSSMGETYGNTGMTKLQAAKKMLRQRTELVGDILYGVNMGLYSYTPPRTGADSKEEQMMTKGYEVYYPMQPFNKAAFLEAIDKLPENAYGQSELQKALNTLNGVLARASGHTVVFIFSDGNYDRTLSANTPVNIAKEMANKYDVNFQIISTADKGMEDRMLKAVAEIGPASRVIPLEDALDHPESYGGAIFVIEESYIIASEEQEKVIGLKLDHILFDFDQSEIKMEFTDYLAEAGKVLQDDPESYIVLAGFTDNQGPAEYNMMLSEKRVKAVAAFLADKYNIEEDRVMTFWYGEEAPIADNNTMEGRKKNRRVLGFIVKGDS